MTSKQFVITSGITENAAWNKAKKCLMEIEKQKQSKF